ncbi:MAG: phosphopantothenoylcysteine decarboxylase [Kiritimatiellae bacterium]|nr:phosphopantothenoylcysteine decarboxylase [Kiritimatiellia bacterium]
MRIVVTAGPTREPIDAVRFISNRSSGKMGYAVAAVAGIRGHNVRLISGPVALPEPKGIEVTRVTTAAEMLGAVMENISWCDALVMAAAVADWRPASFVPFKLKKTATKRVIELEPTPDILVTVAQHKGNRIFVGFAAETGDPVPEAKRKLREKGLDLVVANDVGRSDAGFEVDTNRVVLVTREGEILQLPLLSKYEVGVRIVMWLENRVGRERSLSAP